MAELEKIKQRIRELAARRNNVKLAEIEWVVNQLGRNGFVTNTRSNGHQTLFRAGSVRFGVCSHNPGSAQVKACYVDAFVEAMMALELYEEE
jgi:hypothetical protein